MEIRMIKRRIKISSIILIHSIGIAHANKMERAYINSGKKWMFPPILLIKRREGKGYYCIDGGHRTRTRKKLGYKYITAYVVSEMRATQKDVSGGNMSLLWQCVEFVDKDGISYLSFILHRYSETEGVKKNV